MNLKEAFRYQNKLQSFLDEAQSILDRDANITKVENTYLRRKVMAEAEDETSSRIDLCLVTSDVAYTPPFDVNASFAEAFAVYTGKDEA